jgi:hypothetical protein
MIRTPCRIVWTSRFFLRRWRISAVAAPNVPRRLYLHLSPGSPVAASQPTCAYHPAWRRPSAVMATLRPESHLAAPAALLAPLAPLALLAPPALCEPLPPHVDEPGGYDQRAHRDR